MPDKYITADEAGAIAGFAGCTMKRFANEGKLSAYRPAQGLRFKQSEVIAFMESTKIQPTNG